VDSHPLLNQVNSRVDDLVAECCPEKPEAGILVGLSGGPDSVALLLAGKLWAERRNRPLAAAHLHHGLRGGEADADLEFCRSLCDRLGVMFHHDTVDLRHEARSRGRGLEEAGRHLRRSFFLRILENEPRLSCVATGHHRDDQIETVIMRLFRGTGLDGLRGIRPLARPFIHPMLDLDRSEIVACLEETGQPWRTDSSNLEGENLRARIRRELLPVVRGIFGLGSERAPARLAGLLDRDLALLDRMGYAALDQVRHEEDPTALDVAELNGLDPALASRVLRVWLKPMQPEGLERVHVDGILAWLLEGQSGTARDLPGGAVLAWELDRVLIRTDRTPSPPLRAAADYRIVVARGGSGKEIGDLADETTWRLTCPAETLSGNLQVRNWREGDRFQPFGLDGTKKLSDLLREKRLPADSRPGVLVVSDDAGILWVVGLARAERTRLLPTTTHTVTISVARRTDQPS